MKRSAKVIRANESYGPLRRYAIGDVVVGAEADRLAQLGLAEYNDEEPQQETSTETSAPLADDELIDDETEEKES